MPERAKLLQSFNHFRRKYYEESSLMDDLINNGVYPDFFFINCIDPRSSVPTVFNLDPSKAFGDRVMAALVPSYQEGSYFSASLSYAVKYKKVKHIIIMGHTQCGGIEALVTDIDDKDISGWMSSAKPAFEKAKTIVASNDHDALCAETEKQSIIEGLKNLHSYPAVENAVKKGNVTVNGWLFDMKKRKIFRYNPATDSFENLTPVEKTQGITIKSL